MTEEKKKPRRVVDVKPKDVVSQIQVRFKVIKGGKDDKHQKEQK